MPPILMYAFSYSFNHRLSRRCRTSSLQGGSAGAKIASTETGRGVVPPRAREGSLEFFICERVSTTSVVRNSHFLFTEGAQGGRRGHAHLHAGPRVRLHFGPNSGARAPLDPRQTLGPERPVAASSGGRGVHPSGSPPLPLP